MKVESEPKAVSSGLVGMPLTEIAEKSRKKVLNWSRVGEKNKIIKIN
jgi:hypothetical protein